MILPFKKCNRDVLREMASAFYEKPITIPDLESLDYKWSPAEVNQILFRNFTDPVSAVKELVGLGREDLTGIVENGTELDSVVPRIDE
jgi:hypothetical protein